MNIYRELCRLGDLDKMEYILSLENIHRKINRDDEDED